MEPRRELVHSGLVGAFYALALVPSGLVALAAMVGFSSAWLAGDLSMTGGLFGLAVSAGAVAVLAAPPYFQLVSTADRATEALFEPNAPARAKSAPPAVRGIRLLAQRAGDARADHLLDAIGQRLADVGSRKTELVRHAAADKAAGLPPDEKLAAHKVGLDAEEERLLAASRALRDALLHEPDALSHSDDLIAAARAHAEVG